MTRILAPFFALFALLTLAACEPDPFGRSAAELRAEKAACENSNGDWRKGGLAGAQMCFQRTNDAGKSCTKATECEGVCVAGLLGDTSSGQCSAEDTLFGCYVFFDETGEKKEICVD